MQTIVTTSHKPDPRSMEIAMWAAEQLKSEFVERRRMSLNDLKIINNAENIIVVANSELKLYSSHGIYFFHPSMSVPRIKAIKQGKSDHMIEAMSVHPGDRVLDCTLGLGSDAIVASFVSGPEGQVTGIEATSEIALIVKHGLGNYNSESHSLKSAMERIQVKCALYEHYLTEIPERSYDIVYFDPMFRQPRMRSSSMEPLRGIVKHDPLSPEAVKEAVRVARKRVVMKENSFSKEFARLGFSKVIGGRYSPVAFGVIEKEAEI
ncbi:class I SAM-dependent methyltransferase [Phosphitispora sp. TUW77]|uniref:class I SAM-dependent methyltransferase n=1 Tax=Phosphitispora sp. TUW77 TaxID=3152361 RepID=UPI003AB1A659